MYTRHLHSCKGLARHYLIQPNLTRNVENYRDLISNINSINSLLEYRVRDIFVWKIECLIR